MTRSPARPLVLALLAAALVVALAGCSSGSDAGDGAQSGAADAGTAEAGTAGAGTADAIAGARRVAAQQSGVPQAVVRTGSIELRTDDVEGAQDRVRRVVDRYAGEVTEESTQSDDVGRPSHARMVVRVPTDDFRDAVADLKEAGDLLSASTDEDDVTARVIDVRTRMRVQERSIERISVLFGRAQSIRDVMAIESELSRRQADLEVLQRQAARLSDQTSLSTVTVGIERSAGPRTAADDDTGFGAGLSAGWDALRTAGTGAATAAGAVLPWLAAAAVLGVPMLLLVRALRRRTPPAEEAQSSE